MSKRILIYATAYLPLVGGAELAVKEITDRLPDFEFDLICARLDKNLPKTERLGRVNVYRLGWGLKKLDKLWLACFGHYFGLKLHRCQPVSAVWAIMASFGGFAAERFKQKTHLPYLLTLQEGDPLAEILGKVKKVRNRFNKIFTTADGLQAISNYLFSWGKHMGFRGKIAEVVPNGVDVSLFSKEYPAAEISALRKSFGFPVNTKIIITSSRLVIKNGVADVIKALALLAQDYCFYICGTGPLEAELKALTIKLNVNGRVNFAGHKNHGELPKLLKASDIFIRPSLSEGLGNSFLEAMAAGLPTIGTLVGGIPDFLTDRVTGLVCEPKNAGSIALALKQAGEMSAEAKEALHQNAMNIINERYNWEYIARRMKFIFETLI